MRVIDPSEYQQRMDDFDFDMTVTLFPESDVPGERAAGLLGLRGGQADRQQQPDGRVEPSWSMR